MKMLRLGLPLVVALFALAGAATTAFAAGHPSGAALTPAAGPAQEADEANIETADRATRGDVAVRPDRGDSKHRIATLCYRLHNSDRVATVLRARCAEIFGEALPDPAALCRLLIERGADEQAVRTRRGAAPSRPPTPRRRRPPAGRPRSRSVRCRRR